MVLTKFYILGTLIYYAALSGTLWWMFTAISLLDQLVKNTPQQNPVLKPVFITLGLGVPAIFTAIALGLKAIKYYPGNVFCFGKADTDVVPNPPLDLIS
jgi:hypothetical protein